MAFTGQLPTQHNSEYQDDPNTLKGAARKGKKRMLKEKNKRGVSCEIPCENRCQDTSKVTRDMNRGERQGRINCVDRVENER